MEIKEMQTQQAELVRVKGFSTDPNDIYKFVALLHSEVTEFMDVWKKEPDIERVKERGAEELADIVIRTAHIANILGIDLEKAVEEKMVVNFGREFRYGEVR